MTTVKHILSEKPDEVLTVKPSSQLREALQLMTAHDIGVVIVVDEGKVQGIFSERDLAREVARQECIPLDTEVSTLMTKLVFFVTPDQLIDECMAIMVEKHIRHLPVMEAGKLIGMVSIRDVVREIVSSKDITIRSLENYILGREYA